MRSRHLIPALILLAGCQAGTEAPIVPVVQLADSTAWSGNEVRLVSADFARLPAPPEIVVGSSTRPVRAIDDSTLAVTLPDTNGWVDLTMRLDGVDHPIGQVRVRGFVAWSNGPLLTGVTSPYPGSANPEIMGYAGRDIVRADLRTGNVFQLLPRHGWPSDCLWGPGVSATVPGAFVAPDSNCTLRLYQAGATPTAIDSGPVGQINMGAAHLTGGLWAVGYGDQVMAKQRQAGNTFSNISQTYFSDYVTVWAVSPNGSRIVPTGGSVRTNEFTFVLNASTGQVAYPLQPYRGMTAATFTTEGDTLLVLAHDQAFNDHVAKFRASDGLLLDSTASLVRSDDALDLVSDPVAPVVYAALWQNGGVAILVLDRKTLDVIATLRPPAGSYPAPPNSYGSWNVVIDQQQRQLLLYYHLDFVGDHQFQPTRPNNAFTLRFALN